MIGKVQFVPIDFSPFLLKNFCPLGFAFSYAPTSRVLPDAPICCVIRDLR